MKRLLWMLIGVLALSMVVCSASMVYIDKVIVDLKELTTELILAKENDDIGLAKEKLVALATRWDDEQRILQVLCDHDDLHDVKIHIVEAEICIFFGDDEDFFAAVSLISEALEHMNEAQQLSLENLC